MKVELTTHKMSKTTLICFGVFLLECLYFFFLKQELGFFLSPLVFLAFPIGLLFYFTNQARQELLSSPIHFSHKQVMGIAIALAAVLLVITYVKLLADPINIEKSDIYPLVSEVYLKRVVEGTPVYAPYTGFNYGTFTPNYLPFHWFPFLPSYVLKADLRWVPVILFFLVSFVLVYRCFKEERNTTDFLLIALAPLIFYTCILTKQAKELAHTLELLFVAYYLLLGLAIFHERIATKIMSIIMILLSRYSALFWLPLWVKQQWHEDKRKFWLGALGVILGLLLFYVLPFVSQTPQMLSSGADLWVNASLNEWDGQSWQQPGDKPFQLFRGNGFASWFYYWYPGSLQEKIYGIKNFMLLVPALLSLVFFFLKKPANLKANFYLLLLLKLSLSVFYAFVLIPYDYLYWVPIGITILIIRFAHAFRVEPN